MAARPGSPTELIPESSEDEDLASIRGDENEKAGDVGGCARKRDEGAMAVDATGGSPGRGKRTREPAGPSGARPRRHGGDRPDDGGAEPIGSESAPVTSGELCRLLEVHLGPLAASWSEMTGKVKDLEEEREKDRQARDALLGRVVHIEQERTEIKTEREAMHGRLARVEQKTAGVDAQIVRLTKDVEDLKQKASVTPAVGSGSGAKNDPWAEYRVKHGPAPGMPGSTASTTGQRDVPPGGSVAGEELSEEDKRTLVIGGWAQDSKRQVILDESAGFLGRAAVKDLIDQTSLTVWGPRRSFGVLEFVLRDGESPQGMRDRMWGVIQSARNDPFQLDSTANLGTPKKLWCSFTKTREARRRSAHGSMLRRVCLGAVEDAAASGEAHNLLARAETAYEVDWGSGTVWVGEWKLGSATHRMPKGDGVKQMSSGWLDLNAISRATGIAYDVAVQAFEREL